jgi:ppGpp synthetase/RelA/SpoT-type nucleotidyltranferase
VHDLSRRLKKSWNIRRTRDYIARPKPSGYRALHHIVRRDDRMIEVQLRTVLQDAWANQVEEDGHDVNIGFKFGHGPPEIHGYYRTVAEAFAFVDRGEALPSRLVEDLNVRYARIQGVLPGRRTLT